MKSLKKFLPIVSVAVAAIAIVMFFLPFVNWSVEALGVKGTCAFNGFQAAFGAKEISYTIGSTTFKNGETKTVVTEDTEKKLAYGFCAHTQKRHKCVFLFLRFHSPDFNKHVR